MPTRRRPAQGVDVGIIDTGIDGSHPDLEPNFDAELSRNFTTDIPAIDGPCEVATCVDPADTDDNGHGTHVAGIVAAADNDFGILGVAPDATLVNLRAGQDSGFFFLYETVAALVYAGAVGLDVVNMSFFTDPWLYNCTSRDEYIEGDVTDEELAEQRLVRELVEAAVGFAHERGVTLVGSAGNEHADKAAPTRFDDTSPDFPPDAARPRTVAAAVSPCPTRRRRSSRCRRSGRRPRRRTTPATGSTRSTSRRRAAGSATSSAPPQFQTPGNLVLSSYPLDVAIEQELADPAACRSTSSRSGTATRTACAASTPTCRAPPWPRRTSPVWPPWSSRPAADRTGHGGRASTPTGRGGSSSRRPTDHACPAGGVEIYTDEGRTPDWNALCEGTTDENGLYGEGIVNAAAAVEGSLTAAPS